MNERELFTCVVRFYPSIVLSLNLIMKDINND